MKNLFLICALLAACIAQGQTAPKYVKIYGSILEQRFVDVDRPKNLKRWYYDRQTNTFYRAYNSFYIPVRIYTQNIIHKGRYTTLSKPRYNGL